MLTRFFYTLREAGVPASVTEYLTLLEALQARVAQYSVDDFYFLARATLVKDEKHFDRFDRAFAHHFKGIEQAFERLQQALPEDWLKLLAQRQFTPEEMAQIEALGGWDKLMETLKQRLEEQKGRHEGGNKWIGTAGTSPFGHGGYNPEGIRIGGAGGKGRAVKVWERRDYRNLDDQVELGTRNIKVALRKLRRFAREGAADQFDIDGTISATARNAGLLDLKFQPERHNALKLLLFFDVCGSMVAHVRVCEELFSAARSEFKHLEYFYFHNFVYESVWKNNLRRTSERTSTQDLLHKYGADYKVIFIGDASMSPYEITVPGGSVEHMNEEPGSAWVKRVTGIYEHCIWLNPVPESHWGWTPSIKLMQDLMENRMYPLTLGGLDAAMKELMRLASAQWDAPVR